MSETQIHLRVTKALHQEITDYAESYGTSVAAAARILIRKGLQASEPMIKMHYSYRSGPGREDQS